MEEVEVEGASKEAINRRASVLLPAPGTPQRATIKQLLHEDDDGGDNDIDSDIMWEGMWGGYHKPKYKEKTTRRGKWSFLLFSCTSSTIYISLETYNEVDTSTNTNMFKRKQ